VVVVVVVVGGGWWEGADTSERGAVGVGLKGGAWGGAWQRSLLRSSGLQSATAGWV
jgi:hypothetical protein